MIIRKSKIDTYARILCANLIIKETRRGAFARDFVIIAYDIYGRAACSQTYIWYFFFFARFYSVIMSSRGLVHVLHRHYAYIRERARVNSVGKEKFAVFASFAFECRARDGNMYECVYYVSYQKQKQIRNMLLRVGIWLVRWVLAINFSSARA